MHYMHSHKDDQKQRANAAKQDKSARLVTNFVTISSPFCQNFGHHFDHENAWSRKCCGHVHMRWFCPYVWSGGNVYLAFLRLV